MKSFAIVLKLAANYKFYCALNIVFNIFYAIFNLLTLLLFIPFLKLIFTPLASLPVLERPVFNSSLGTAEAYKTYYSSYFDFYMNTLIAESGKQGALIFICITIAVLFLLKNFFRYMAMYYIAYVRNHVVLEFRKKIHDKFIALPLGFYTNKRKGDLVSRLSNDVFDVDFSIMNTLELIFREPFTILIFLISMLLISPSLTLISLLLMPLSALVIGRVNKSLKNAAAKGQSKLGMLLATADETLTGLRIIKGFNAQKQAEKKFDTINHEYTKISTKIYRQRDLASPLSEFLGSLVMVAMVWFGGSLILSNEYKEISGEQFIGFIIVFSQLVRPVQGVFTAWSYIKKGMASYERINEILKSDLKIHEKENAQPLKNFNNKVSYENVCFSYDGSSLVLDKVSFEIPKGKTIALVGRSGSGKSTLADLLPRFYDVSAGSIKIDGIDIRDCKLNDVRALMGIVSQESILFNDTVLHNICLGDDNPDLNRAIEAAKIANAHEFIQQLENNYYSNIGDRGNKLSGGQRQRLAIARAVYKNPPILILDEATSALDTESEKLVQDALSKLMHNRTTLVIAHRLSTIQYADEILVLEKGKIIERGKHNELLALNGIYKKLCDLQTFV